MTILILGVALGQLTVPAQATTKSELVVRGFQNYVTNAKASLKNTLKDYENDLAVLNSVYSKAKDLAQNVHEQELLSAAKKYEPQVTSSKELIKEAQVNLLKVNQVQILNLGSFRSYWGNLDCPTSRPQCVSLDDKGNLFRVGEVATLKATMGERVDYLNEIQIMLDLGLIQMLNPLEYQKFSSVIRFEPAKILLLNTSWEEDKARSVAKLNQALEVARKEASGPMLALMEKRDSNVNILETRISAGVSALKAAKRASKNSSFFDRAFVTAFRFDYNAKWLEDVSNLSFSSLDTLRSILSQITVIELADQAALVNASYRYSSAEMINKSVGTAFTSEPEYKMMTRMIILEYKRITKVNLKF